MNTEYAKQHEANDFSLFLELNSKFKLKDLGRMKDGHDTDVSGYTQDDRYIEIELKRRYINVDTYQTIIIEPYKMQYAKQHQDIIQLYVNFTDDDYAIVFNLHHVKNPNKNVYNIPSKLYERTKPSNRYELPVEQAWIYKKINGKYKLIQKGW